MKGTLPFRLTHGAMVLLTIANLLWLSGPSCCCANSKCRSKSEKSCCTAKSETGGCSCCCKNAEGAKTRTSCSRCGTKKESSEDAIPSRSEKTTTHCGDSGACQCGQLSTNSTAPVTRSSPTENQESPPPVIALVEPRMPEVRLAESLERHNHLLAALERPVSIRFGVWRN